MLSSFLLSQSTAKSHVDNDLDAIFAASAKAAPPSGSKDETTAAVHSSHTSSKRKRKEESEGVAQPAKKQKQNAKKNASTSESSTLNHQHDEPTDSSVIPLEKKATQKQSKKHRPKEADALVDDLEERYSGQRIDDSTPIKVSKKKTKQPKASLSETTQSPPSKVSAAGEEESTNSDDDDTDAGALVHETVSGTTAASKRKSVYVPEGETKAQRDERTIFIGNLPFEILKSKSLQKAIKRHILSFAPGHPEVLTKLESIRFRSVAFKAPTNLQALKDDATPSKPSRKQERAFSYRVGKDEDGDAGESKPKTYLSPAEKKRIAFIKGEFHDQASSVNAYAVFAHQDPTHGTTNVPSQGVSPSEVAAMIVQRMDGTQFEGRTLRVDSVTVRDNDHGDSGIRDPASTVFVGNLEFTTREEDLRIFFETLLTTEMGPPSQDDNSPENDNEEQQRIPRWVNNVRIIRDKDTQLGKGFGYVRFTERTCVDEIIAMEPTKLKFAKRKLRVTRCKVAGDKALDKTANRTSAKASSQAPHKHEVTKPKAKGDPLLGERLKGLSKEERREAKKQDPKRLARRMEKKKTRLSMEKSLKRPEKERIRVRKVATVKSGSKRSGPAKRVST